ncbi:MAG TPA: hypothetical protein VGM39_01370 [Kofleriaceae bacterium]
MDKELLPANGAGFYYGWSVAASGDGTRVVVGAPGAASNAGQAFVWHYDGSAWTQEGVLFAMDMQTDDGFGASVAIDLAGATIVVGADHADDDPADNSGAAYVFERVGTGWSQTFKLRATVPNPSDHFGSSSAISADSFTIAVGASGEDGISGGVDADPTMLGTFDEGAVYLFERAGATWTQTHYVKPPTPSEDQLFGSSVALSSDGAMLAVGAPHEATQTGAVYLVEADVPTTTRLAANNASVGDNFGYAVGLSGDGRRVIAGAPGEDGAGRGTNSPQDEDGPESGAAYIFERTSAWTQIAFVKTLTSDPSDQVGVAVSMSGDGSHAVIGAIGETGSSSGRDGVADNSLNNAGAVYELARDSSGAWTQTSYIKALDTMMGDQFGASCAISFDGFGIAVGAPYRNGTTGAVYVYLQALD